jgi:hypothetical protein
VNNPKITQALDALIAAIREDLLSRVEVQFNPFAGNGKLFSTRLPAEKANGSPRPGQKRDPKALAALTESLRRAIETAPGSRIEYIGKQLGAETKDLVLPVKKLLAAKRIRTTGHKRATQYYPRGV